MDFKFIYSSDHVAVIFSDKRLNNDHMLQWHCSKQTKCAIKESNPRESPSLYKIV